VSELLVHVDKREQDSIGISGHGHATERYLVDVQGAAEHTGEQSI